MPLPAFTPSPAQTSTPFKVGDETFSLPNIDGFCPPSPKQSAAVDALSKFAAQSGGKIASAVVACDPAEVRAGRPFIIFIVTFESDPPLTETRAAYLRRIADTFESQAGRASIQRSQRDAEAKASTVTGRSVRASGTPHIAGRDSFGLYVAINQTAHVGDKVSAIQLLEALTLIRGHIIALGFMGRPGTPEDDVALQALAADETKKLVEANERQTPPEPNTP